jgi:hypothetical protein
VLPDEKPAVSDYKIVVEEEPNGALDDLKPLGRSVRDELFDVMRTELREGDLLDPDDPCECRIQFECGGTSVERLIRLGARRGSHLARDPEAESEGARFWILYRPFTPSEYLEYGAQRGFFVERILPQTAVARMLLDQFGNGLDSVGGAEDADREGREDAGTEPAA